METQEEQKAKVLLHELDLLGFNESKDCCLKHVSTVLRNTYQDGYGEGYYFGLANNPSKSFIKENWAGICIGTLLGIIVFLLFILSL